MCAATMEISMQVPQKAKTILYTRMNIEFLNLLKSPQEGH
jgi:hypothetical protein